MSSEPPEVLLDHGLEPDPDTVERGPNLRWWWIAATVLVAAVALGVGGAIFGGESTPTPAAAPAPPAPTPAGPTAPASQNESEPAAPSADAQTPATPAPTTPPGLPRQVPPFASATPIVLIGHHPSGALAAVRPDGSVTELVPSSGRGFLPQASNGRTLLGLMNAGAAAVVLAPDDSQGLVAINDRDAPAYYPLHDGSGYIVHGTWLGKLHYVGNDGAQSRQGPDLARGTRILGDTVEGLAVQAIDGTALIVDRTTGEVLRRLASVPLAIAGNHQVVVACRDASDCSLEIQTLDGETTGVLDADPVIAERLIAGMSHDGTRIAYLDQPNVTIVDITGTTVVSFAERSPDHVIWGADSVVVVGQATQLWQPELGEPVVLDIATAIDPGLRGIVLLEDGAVDEDGLLVPIEPQPDAD